MKTLKSYITERFVSNIKTSSLKGSFEIFTTNNSKDSFKLYCENIVAKGNYVCIDYQDTTDFVNFEFDYKKNGTFSIFNKQTIQDWLDKHKPGTTYIKNAYHDHLVDSIRIEFINLIGVFDSEIKFKIENFNAGIYLDGYEANVETLDFNGVISIKDFDFIKSNKEEIEFGIEQIIRDWAFSGIKHNIDYNYFDETPVDTLLSMFKEQ